MNVVGMAVLVLSLLGGADEGESARALDRLQGDWTLVSAEANGESLTEEPGEADRLTVLDARLTVRLNGRSTSYSVRLEPSSVPKALELTVESGPAKGQVLKGIYKLDGDLFTICHGMTSEADRPVEFSTGAESGHALIVWRRTERREPR